jgi:hypothetical protein
MGDIRNQMKLGGKPPESEAWWEKLWGNLQHGLASIVSALA